ncbi:hypothetical protein KL918_000004 [Ogataea parapolymorpha]|nr:hypothetical protein KL916_005299 [Ogataea parapolymorpha]KAG7869800.1 hypothetical protein KL918_000004 [Ogataea parapolymorpha]
MVLRYGVRPQRTDTEKHTDKEDVNGVSNSNLYPAKKLKELQIHCDNHGEIKHINFEGRKRSILTKFLYLKISSQNLLCQVDLDRKMIL